MDAGIEKIINLVLENPQILKIALNLLGNSKGKEENKEENKEKEVFSGLLNGFLSDNTNGGGEKTVNKEDENEKRVKLLEAIEPYLSENRQKSLETVIKFLKIGG